MPNVLFILADALRSKNLHCYGYPKETSPNIDKLASEGVLFKNAIACSNHTLPGMVSLFTGMYPTTHGIDSPRNLANWEKLWEGWITPLDELNKRGHLTVGPDKWAYGRLNYKIEIKNPLDFISKNKDKDFFLWYRIAITHLPYNPSPPYDKMFLPKGYKMSEATLKKLGVVKSKTIIHKPGLISQVESGDPNLLEAPDDGTAKEYPRTVGIINLSEEDRIPIVALYDGEVRTLDDLVGRYIKELEELGILDKTIIIFTSDHGEELLERGSVGHSSCSLSGTLYDENIRIPLIIRYPSAIPGGRVIETQVSQVDVMPTIFEMLGFKYPGRVDGVSLIPLIKGERINFKEETYAETLTCGWQVLKGDKRRIWCIRTPDWKLIYYSNPLNQEENYYELFNLGNDPEEKINVIDRNPDIYKKLKGNLNNWLSKALSLDVI
jgi:arylsulfatase A-like enzyme